MQNCLYKQNKKISQTIYKTKSALGTKETNKTTIYLTYLVHKNLTEKALTDNEEKYVKETCKLEEIN